MFYIPVNIKFASPQGFRIIKSKLEINGESIWAEQTRAPEVTRTTQRQICFPFRLRLELSLGGQTGTL